MKKIYLIIYSNNDENNAGDIYCAATSHELAQKIIDADIAKGDLIEGAFISECNLFNKITK